MAKKKQEESIEKQLWKAADKLRKNIDAAEYKHVVMGLVFLKYISDSFEELYNKLKAEEDMGADPEDRDEYKAENVFFVPPTARWSHLLTNAKLPNIGKIVDEAMDAIEKENNSLKGVLPKVYARDNLDSKSLGGLIDLIGNIAFGDAKARSADVLGHVFEYFLGEFALAEGKQGGQFYTPKSVVELLVKMLEPYKGRVFDPCCGSGGMFVQSEKFVTEHQGKINDISIYGQESNQTTWRLAKMNLAIRGIDSSQVKWNNEGSFLNDAHKDLKADFIIANPPFNDSDWSGDLLRNDGRWNLLGTPPVSNANFAWIQHFLYHLNQNGRAAFVLADTSLSNSNNDETSMRKKLVKNNMIDCIISLPSHLFSNTQITACIWLLSKNKENVNLSPRSKKEILFIDASKLGYILKRKHKILTDDNISKIALTYHNWKQSKDIYEDVAGFNKSVSTKIIESNNFVISPNRYVLPKEQEINLEINLNATSIQNNINRLNDDINDSLESITSILQINSNIKINNIRQLMETSKEIYEFSSELYLGLIKEYFLDLNFNDKHNLTPRDWESKTFAEIFNERKLKVKDFGFCPPIYSVTNSGIQLREGKFSKALSKSTQNYKIAFEGDIVFGLSREIPNLDVFTDKQGAFSGAYHIFSPSDYRLGLLIGSIMRLKLMEQTDVLKGGAREGRALDKDKLAQKTFIIPSENDLNSLWDLL